MKLEEKKERIAGKMGNKAIERKKEKTTDHSLDRYIRRDKTIEGIEKRFKKGEFSLDERYRNIHKLMKET